MVTYESALHMLAVAYIVPLIVLIAASTIGLTVIEAVEEV